MTNTKEIPGPFDALEKAKPDEPIFTLLARDPFAPGLVQDWVDKVRRRAIREIDDPAKTEAELRQASEAERIVWEMLRWQRNEPEEAQGERARYNDAPPNVIAKAAEERHDALLSGARRIDNALAEAIDTAATVRALGLDEQAAEIEMAAAMLKRASTSIRPSRPSYAAQANLEGIV